jgi:REP element-mobilizing transposase RayT
LNYHLIFCVKYRRKVLVEKISNRLKEIVSNVSKDFQVKIIDLGTDKDHIHILFKTKPTIIMTKYINSVKGVSSRKLFLEFPEIKLKLWKGHLWSRSYCLLTTEQTTLNVLKKYVESQGEKIIGKRQKENKIETRNISSIKENNKEDDKCYMYWR